jgi:hypothetical protein
MEEDEESNVEMKTKVVEKWNEVNIPRAVVDEVCGKDE